MSNEDLNPLAEMSAVIRQEADALIRLSESLDKSFSDCLKLIESCRGKLIVTGVGKSGHIARKIAGTFSSTGMPAIFLHPSEAMHGDLGNVSPDDLVLALGKSGESDELNELLKALKRQSLKIIAITAKADSTMAATADIVLLSGVTQEACPLNLVPTTSTMAALAIGDALALTLMRIKKFRPEDFALYHPGGKLGRKLLLKVSDLMIPRAECPVLDPDKTSIQEVIVALGKYGLGIVFFAKDKQQLKGIFTDGDLRRLLDKHKADVFNLKVTEVMNRKPIVVQDDEMAVHALRLMEERERPLNVMPVCRKEEFVGVVRLHELVRVA